MPTGRLRDLAREALELGPRGLLFRLRYEALNASGATALLQPVETHPAARWRSSSTLPEKGLKRFWLRERPRFFLDESTVKGASAVLARLLTEPQKEGVVSEASRAARGVIRCFSAWDGDFGDPPDWHRNPTNGKSWPKDVHWSRALMLMPTYGDVKLTWEASRFPHVYALLRAAALTGDPAWGRVFFKHLESWEASNPYRAGVNWASGQELAIRACSWLIGLYAFGADSGTEDADIERAARLLFLHAEHIEKNLAYARRAVRNNHLIGEALALLLIGSYFPWFKHSARWRRLGRTLLTGECLEQFYGDGGYCQSSHTYHRLALQYYLWAFRCAECLGEPLPGEVRALLARSRGYLLAFLNSDGRLPNWGSNDGASLHLLSSCDYGDFRPLLTALAMASSGQRVFEAGPWEEELLWLWGPPALDRPVAVPPIAKSSFGDSGLHVLRRSPGDFAVFRCGQIRDRFGHADQLHLDLWWRGLNVAQDGGSYLYNDQGEFHRHFMGTASHNTVAVDGMDQMLLHRRFKWLYRAHGRLLGLRDSGATPATAGEHSGYRRLRHGVLHRRTVTQDSERWRVEDRLDPETEAPHTYVLHWLLGPWPTEPDGELGLRIATPAGTLSVQVTHRVASSASPPQFALWRAEKAPVLGWVSRYYGHLEPTWAATLTVTTAGPASFFTEFAPR